MSGADNYPASGNDENSNPNPIVSPSPQDHEGEFVEANLTPRAALEALASGVLGQKASASRKSRVSFQDSPNHGGGVQSFDPNTATAGAGIGSAQISDNLASPGVEIRLGKALSEFPMLQNAFDRSAPAVTGKLVQSANFALGPPSNVPAAPSGSQPGHDRRSSVILVEDLFSKMSAECLSKAIVSKITTFPTERWIQEDLSGPAILESVEPSDLGDLLEHVAKISSPFMRTRVETTLLALIEKDSTITSELRQKWLDYKARRGVRTFSPQTSAPSSPAGSAIAPSQLFSSPIVAASTQHLSSPAFFSGQIASQGEARPNTAPSFLKEVAASSCFSLSSPSIFGDSSSARASVSPSAQGMGSSPQIGGFNITINQPAASPPKFIILESTSDPSAFALWLKKNRKEFMLSRKVDHKKWNELIDHDARDVISRIIVAAKTTTALFHDLFNDTDCPYPSSWDEVSDTLLFKVLFGLHGPRNSTAAKDKLMTHKFYFNDSTTFQDQFTGKIRKHGNVFKQMIRDFAYNHHQWPSNDELSHSNMVDAYAKTFDSTETVKGRDGVTMVAKCSNMAIVRDIIQNKKGLPLEDIINHVADYFDRNDIMIRSSKGVGYNIVPWNVQARKAQKRSFNQIAPARGGAVVAQGGNAGARPPRPPPIHPRCCNCGSKMHEGTERRCYLWGHPKGKGAQGVWAENGGPSLRLSPQEWKDWKVIRHAVFYGYPENAGPKPNRSQGA